MEPPRLPPFNNSSSYALQVDASKNEIYAAGSTYGTYVYTSAGLTSKAVNTAIAPATSSFDEVELLSGRLYTDEGRVYDAESGDLLGTIYLTGTTAAQGATLADADSGKIFVVDNANGNLYSAFNQIQIFNTSDYTATGTTIPVNGSTSVFPYGSSTRLTRWGANGLLFHTNYGVYSLRSNAVVDLHSASADLGVTLTSGGGTTTGVNTVFTAKVTNAGPSTATDTVLTLQTAANGSLVSIIPSLVVPSSTVSIHRRL